MASRLLRPIRPAAVVVTALSVLAIAIAACQDAPLFVFDPPGHFVWVYTPSYSGEYRAQDLEIAALVQLTKSGEGAYLNDVSYTGKLAVSPYPTLDTGGTLQPSCGLLLLSPRAGDVQRVSDGMLGLPWGALFSPDGEKMAFAATEDCPLAPGHDLLADLQVLDLSTMENTTLYEGERAPVLRGWAATDIILAMREVPNLGWTYRKIWLDPRSEIVPDLVIEYRGLNLFIDKPSPRGNMVLLVDEFPPGSSFNSELSLASLITTEPIGDPWEGWLHPQAGHSPWSPDNRSLVYLMAGSVRDGMPIDVMTLDPETGEHTPILTGLNAQSDAYLPQAWSPKSELVLLLTDDRSALHAVNADGSGYSEVPGSSLDEPLSTYRNVRWFAHSGYLFFERHAPLERGVMLTSVKSEIWAAVVRLPGESDRSLQERVQKLRSGPWPVSLAR